MGFSKKIATFAIGLTLVVSAFASVAKADDATGSWVPAVPTKAAEKKSLVAPVQRATIEVTYTNADEAALPGTDYEVRTFLVKTVHKKVRDQRDPVTHRWHYHWEDIEVLKPLGSLTTALDAGDTFGFDSKRFSFRGSFKVRGEVWRGSVLVASRYMSGTVAGIIHMPLTFGQNTSTGGTTGGQKGILKIADFIDLPGPTTGTKIGFPKAQLFLPDVTIGAVGVTAVFEVSFDPSNGVVDNKLDLNEEATVPQVTPGTYQLLVVSNVPATGNFKLAGTIIIVAGQTTSVQMRDH